MFQEGSGPSNFLAQTVRQIIAREGGLFDAQASADNTPVLLILDRYSTVLAVEKMQNINYA